MMAAATLPELPGIGAPVPTKRFLLACLDGQKRLRMIRGNEDLHRWVRAYARRWFVVDAKTADEGRRAVEKYLDECAAHVSSPVDAAQFGIIDAGHNQPGGPRALPRALGGVPVTEQKPTRRRRPARDREGVRPTPAQLRRRARAQGRLTRGKSLL